MATSEAAAPTSWEESDQPTASDPEGSAEPAGQATPPETDTPSPIEAATDTGSQATPAEVPTGAETPAATAAAPTPPAPDAKPDTKPFSFAVDGSQVDVPGAIESDDGFIVIPRDSWNRHVQTRVANRDSWRRERELLTRQLAEASDPEKNPVVQQAKLLVGEVEKLKTAGPTGVVDWALAFLNNLPVLEANARAAAAEARNKRFETDKEAVQEQQLVEHFTREIPKNLRAEIADSLKAPNVAALGLNADDLFDQLWEMRHSIYFDVPEDLPEHGLRKGDVGVRRDVIRNHIGRFVRFAQQQKTTADEVRKAKERNAAAVQTGTTAPPAVTTKDSPAPGGKKGKKPTNYNEWVESLD